MSGSITYSVRVVATGFMILVLSAIPLLCGRFYCALAHVSGMPQEARQVQASPSRLLPDSAERGPDVNIPSVAQARIVDRRILLRTLGIADYIESRKPGGRRCDVLCPGGVGTCMYFDRASGRIARYGRRIGGDDQDETIRSLTYYAGPEGISLTPSDDLGRFVAPVAGRASSGPGHILSNQMDPVIVYDRALRRFFCLDWERQTVRAGPQQPASYVFRSFGSQDDSVLDVRWDPPWRLQRDEDAADERRQSEPGPAIPYAVGNAGRYVPVFTDSRRVDLLDRQTLELVTDKGFLPAPKTLCGEDVARPGQLLDYAVLPVYTGHELEYTGLLAASVSRRGTSLALAVFDASGRPSGRVFYSHGPVFGDDKRTLDSARFAMLETPRGPVLAAGKCILESLHPPVLTLTSFFVGRRLEAHAGHRSLFLVPDSFAAMQQDRVGSSVIWRFCWAFWVMLPAFALAAFLAWRVLRDAVLIGLSENACLLWLLGVVAFGLPGYLTYRLTRPTCGLVTCPNCGRMRRTDAEKCHRCGSPWLVPELIAPTWRVLGAEEDRSGNDAPAPAERLASDGASD